MMKTQFKFIRNIKMDDVSPLPLHNENKTSRDTSAAIEHCQNLVMVLVSGRLHPLLSLSTSCSPVFLLFCSVLELIDY